MMLVKQLSVLFGILLGYSLPAYCQQLSDEDYKPPPFTSRYSQHNGPVIFIDEAHNNFHTLRGRYAPFAKLANTDGYTSRPGTAMFTGAYLRNKKILVIANALHAENRSRWTQPVLPAFTPQEIEALNKWVKQGGSLLLIADHMPFAGAAAALAASFGFHFYDCFAVDTNNENGQDIFTKRDGTLSTAHITAGLDSFLSFTGQAFDIPPAAIPILTLGSAFKLFLCSEAWNFNTGIKKINGAGKHQGAIMKYGNGRIAVFGEAAMFTAQVTGNIKTGMNHPLAANNYRLLLNVLHWLDE